VLARCGAARCGLAIDDLDRVVVLWRKAYVANPLMAQPSEPQPLAKPLSPALERMIEAMPPDAQPVIRQMLESDPAARRRLELGEEREADKRPHWTKETTLRKIEAVFPDSDPTHICDMLESSQLGCRVQLAIIKLCNEGKGLSDLAHNMNAAKLDYRDVLSWAEYPNDCELPACASDSDREAAQQRDHEQYLGWIKQDRKGTD